MKAQAVKFTEYKRFFSAIQNELIGDILRIVNAAAAEGYLEALLIQRNQLGETGCMVAIRLRKYRIVELLIEKDANTQMVNAIDHAGWTSLHYAVTSRETALASLLLRHGANVNAVTREELFTPLMLAIKSQHSDLLKLILQEDPNLEIKDSTGRTAINHALASDNSQSILNLMCEKLSPYTVSLHFSKEEVHLSLGTWTVWERRSLATFLLSPENDLLKCFPPAAARYIIQVDDRLGPKYVEVKLVNYISRVTVEAIEERSTLYTEIVDFARWFPFTEKDGMFWEWVNKQLEIKGLTPVVPNQLKDSSWAKRILANVFSCIGLLVESILDLSLSVASIFDSFNGFGFAAAIVSTLSFFMHLYVFWSSLKPMSKYASTSSGSMLLMVLLTDCSDSLFLTAVGKNVDPTTILAAFIPLLAPAAEILLTVCWRPDHLISQVVVLQCLASPFIISFHGLCFQGERAAESTNDSEILIFMATIAVTSAVSLLFSSAAAKAWVDPDYDYDYLLEMMTLDAKVTSVKKRLHEKCWLTVAFVLTFLLNFVQCAYVFINAMAIPVATFLTMYLLAEEANVPGVLFVLVLVFRSVVVLLYFMFEIKKKEKATKVQPIENCDQESRVVVEMQNLETEENVSL